jgi:hypothetical protein
MRFRRFHIAHIEREMGGEKFRRVTLFLRRYGRDIGTITVVGTSKLNPVATQKRSTENQRATHSFCAQNRAGTMKWICREFAENVLRSRAPGKPGRNKAPEVNGCSGRGNGGYRAGPVRCRPGLDAMGSVNMRRLTIFHNKMRMHAPASTAETGQDETARFVSSTGSAAATIFPACSISSPPAYAVESAGCGFGLKGGYSAIREAPVPPDSHSFAARN